MSDYISFRQGYMDDCAKWQYNDSGARAINEINHAYGWKALLSDGTKEGLHLQWFCTAHFTSRWRVVLTDMGPNGWKFHCPQDHSHKVQPTMIIPLELGWNVEQIRAACERYMNNWRYVQKWLSKANNGRTFTLSDKVQIIHVFDQSAEQLRQRARDTAKQYQRFDLLTWAKKVIRAKQEVLSDKIIYAMSLYTGDDDFNEDYASAADRPGNFLVLSSDNTAIEIPDYPQIPRERRAAYDMAHELLHNLGLEHSSESQGPDYSRSIMTWGEPPTAILTNFEKQKLGPSPYLKAGIS